MYIRIIIYVSQNVNNTPSSDRTVTIPSKFYYALVSKLVSNEFDMFHFVLKSHKNKEKPRQSRGFYGCGGRTRTYDLRVMSPTSYQLLYSAIFSARGIP